MALSRSSPAAEGPREREESPLLSDTAPRLLTCAPGAAMPDRCLGTTLPTPSRGLSQQVPERASETKVSQQTGQRTRSFGTEVRTPPLVRGTGPFFPRPRPREDMGGRTRVRENAKTLAVLVTKIRLFFLRKGPLGFYRTPVNFQSSTKLTDVFGPFLGISGFLALPLPPTLRGRLFCTWPRTHLTCTVCALGMTQSYVPNVSPGLQGWGRAAGSLLRVQ